MISKTIRPGNFLFLTTLFLSTIIIITSSNWIIIWFRIEVNLISLIPLIASVTKTRSLEAVIKYFLVQTIGSLSILISVIILNTLPISNIRSLILIMSIIIKMGVVPFHVWLPQIFNRIPWLICFLIITWQKVGPILITSYILDDWSYQILIILAIINRLLGSVRGVSQTQIRPLMAYSSIAHMGWIVRAIIISSTLIIIYFSIYTIIRAIVIIPLIKEDKKRSTNFNLSKTTLPKIKTSLSINLLSIGGMPPFIGFIPKWLVIIPLVSYSPLLSLILLLRSIVSLYFYLKIVLVNTINTNKSIEQNKISSNLILTGVQILLPILILIKILCNK